MYIPILHDDDKIPISWMSLGDSVTIISKFIVKKKEPDVFFNVGPMCIY